MTPSSPDTPHSPNVPQTPHVPRGLDVLIADDDATLRERLARALRERGFEVRTAANYKDAMAASREKAPKFALVDLRMPGPSGLDLIRDLKALAPDSRVILLTGYGSIATAVDAIRLGAHNVLSKPADADEVVAALLDEDGRVALPDGEGIPAPTLARAEWEHIHRVLADCSLGPRTYGARAKSSGVLRELPNSVHR